MTLHKYQVGDRVRYHAHHYVKRSPFYPGGHPRQYLPEHWKPRYHTVCEILACTKSSDGDLTYTVRWLAFQDLPPETDMCEIVFSDEPSPDPYDPT